MIRSESTKCLPWPAARSAVGAARAPVAAAAALTAVALAVLGAGPAVAAVRARPQAPASVAAAPAKVKYYVVPAPAHGSVPTLYSIAAATLGDGSLFMEIFKLNKGRPQPGGQRLESPHSVEPGWILLLPPGASGPGVRFGPLPATAKATSRVVHQHPARAQAAASGGSAAAGAAYGSGTIVETVIGGALLVFAAAGLGLVLRRRRRSGGGGRRRPARATQAGPGGDWVRGLATDPPGDAAPGGVAPGAAGPGWPDTGYPSWPANAPGHTLTPDHPSWPASDIGRPVGAAQRGRPGGDSPDWPYPDHPSWPANGPGHTLTPDHPSWPASDIGRPVGVTTGYGQTGDAGGPGWPYPDHPSWPAGGPDHPVGGDDYPSWPAADPGGGRAGPGVSQARPGGPPPASPSPLNGGAGLPQRERLEAAPAPAVHHDPGSRQLAPQVPPARGRHVRVPAGYSGSADDTSQRWSAQLARTTGPIPQTYYDLAFPDGRLQVVLTEAPGADQGWAAPGSTSMLQLTTGADTGQQNAVAWQGADPGSADSVRLAQRILADADQQAAEIRLEASAQAAAIRDAAEREAAQIREQTAAEAAPIREGAEREAAEIREQAAAQAAAIREAAEQEAAELRAHLMAMSAELARVAAYVTENLASPPPGIKTIAVPVLEPAAEPVARPAARPGTAPRRPATRPGTRPAAKPAGKPKTRQLKAMRKIAAAAAVLVLFVAVSGATEIGLHGFKFFVFRSAGTGATNGNSLQENQGPGQPDAPGTHHPKAHATGQHHQKAQAHGKRQHGAKANHGKSARHSAQKK
jgi:hypothetical protein